MRLKRTEKKTGDTDPIVPLVFHFNENEFSTPPVNFGAKLTDSASLVLNGNAEEEVGSSMSGGRIEIYGNGGERVGGLMSGGVIEIIGSAGTAAGWVMMGGSLEIYGDAGEMTGNSMSGGTLNIHGDVIGFDSSAFSPENHGTIIWKGTTLWDNGWTKEGSHMLNNGQIPRES